MASKLLYLLMDLETFDCFTTEIPIIYNQSIDLLCKSMDWFLYARELMKKLIACVKTGQRCNQSPSIMVLLTKIVSNFNIKTLTILAKRLISQVAGLGPGRVSADGYRS